MKNVYTKSFKNAPPPKHISSSWAFTLAEVLITLGIIGVVAAMTMPALVNQTNRKQDAAKIKSLQYNVTSCLIGGKRIWLC